MRKEVKIYYSNSSGSDSAGDGTIENPFRTTHGAILSLPKDIKDCTVVLNPIDAFKFITVDKEGKDEA